MRSRILSYMSPLSPRSRQATAPLPQTRFRPRLDILEDRTCPAINPLVNLPVSVGDLAAVTNTVNGQQVQQLQAPVNIGGLQAGTLTLDASTVAPSQQGATTPILDLHIDPIHLNLLGLHVDTSAICLDVTAQPGGLLGNVLSGLASGLDTQGILSQLGSHVADLNTLLDQVDHLLDGVLDQNMKVTEVLGTPATSKVTTPQPPTSGAVDILNLSLGPINLNLLGLGVSLDNCNNGPVTVDVTADPNGGLLGELLGGLGRGPLAGIPINRLIGRLDHLIDSVTNLADRLDTISALPDRFQQLADRLIDQVTHVAEHAGSLANLDRVISRVDRTLNRLDKLIDNTDIPPAVTNQLQNLFNQLTRIVNRYLSLTTVDNASAQLERIIDRALAAL